MYIEVHRNETSQPIVYPKACNAYTKGVMYCVIVMDNNNKKMVHKYPLSTLFRVVESYGD